MSAQGLKCFRELADTNEQFLADLKHILRYSTNIVAEDLKNLGQRYGCDVIFDDFCSPEFEGILEGELSPLELELVSAGGCGATSGPYQQGMS